MASLTSEPALTGRRRYRTEYVQGSDEPVLVLEVEVSEYLYPFEDKPARWINFYRTATKKDVIGVEVLPL